MVSARVGIIWNNNCRWLSDGLCDAPPPFRSLAMLISKVACFLDPIGIGERQKGAEGKQRNKELDAGEAVFNGLESTH